MPDRDDTTTPADRTNGAMTLAELRSMTDHLPPITLVRVERWHEGLAENVAEVAAGVRVEVTMCPGFESSFTLVVL